MIKANELASLEEACIHYNLTMYKFLSELEDHLISNAIFSNGSKGYNLYIPKKLYGTLKNPSTFARDLTQYLFIHGYTITCDRHYCSVEHKYLILDTIRYYSGIDITKIEDKYVKMNIKW